MYLLTGLLGSSIAVIQEHQDGGEDGEEGTCKPLQSALNAKHQNFPANLPINVVASHAARSRYIFYTG